MAVSTRSAIKTLITNNIKNNTSGTDFITPVELAEILQNTIDTLRTVNGNDILGTGDIVVSGGGGTIDSTPTSGSANAVSSGGTFTALAAKQATLVSGTNIKTINGATVLGSGDIVISAAGETNQSGSMGTAGAWRARGVGTITVAKALGVVTVSISAGGHLSSLRLFIPSSEAAGANLTVNFNYDSNTAFNTSLVNAKPPTSKMYDATATPTRAYVPRFGGSGTDFVEEIQTVGSGNITMFIDQIPAGIQANDILFDFKF
jgi:hypothetical protein